MDFKIIVCAVKYFPLRAVSGLGAGLAHAFLSSGLEHEIQKPGKSDTPVGCFWWFYGINF